MRYKLLNKNEVSSVLNMLYKMYPVPQCGLIYTTPFELMLSLILAAQCTDERVNKIRPCLTEKYPTPHALKEAGIKNIYEIIKSCSFPNNKAKHIWEASVTLIEKFDSEVPDTMSELTTIPRYWQKKCQYIVK